MYRKTRTIKKRKFHLTDWQFYPKFKLLTQLMLWILLYLTDELDKEIDKHRETKTELERVMAELNDL